MPLPAMYNQKYEVAVLKYGIVCAALLALFCMTATAQAACTPEEAQQKAMTYSQALQTKAQKDPNNYAKVMQELQGEMNKVQQEQNMDALCAFYDKAIEKLK